MKSKKILAAALACALIISAASGATSAFAASSKVDAIAALQNDTGLIYSDSDGSVEVTINYVDVNGDPIEGVENGSATVYVAITEADEYDLDPTLDPDTDVIYVQDGEEFRLYDPDTDTELGPNDYYGKTTEYSYKDSTEIDVPAPDGYEVDGTYKLADVAGGALTVKLVEESSVVDPDGGDDNTDPGDNENQIDAYKVYVDYYTGYNYVDYTTVDVPANAKEFKVTAPGNLKDNLNEVASWSYSIEILDANYSLVKTEEGSVAPGKDIVITLEEGQQVNDYITFNAEWKNPDGKINATENIYGGIVFYSSAAKGDKFNDEEAYEPVKNSGDYYLWLDRQTATIDVVIDLSTGERTYPKNPTFKVPEVKVPEKKGYKFVGWSTSPNGKVEYKTGDAIAIKADKDGDYYLSISTQQTTDYGIYYEYATFYAVYEKEGNPGTGDGFTAVPLIASAVVSLSAASGVMVYKKKRDLSEEAE